MKKYGCEKSKALVASDREEVIDIRKSSKKVQKYGKKKGEETQKGKREQAPQHKKKGGKDPVKQRKE